MNETEGLRFRRVHRPQVITDELPENRSKGSGTYSGKVFKVTLISLGCFLLLPLLVIILIIESPIHPEVFSLKEPPLMKGCWEPNLKLRDAQRLFEDQITGPESIANIGDVLYAGTADGKIVKLVGRRIITVARLGKLPCVSGAIWAVRGLCGQVWDVGISVVDPFGAPCLMPSVFRLGSIFPLSTVAPHVRLLIVFGVSSVVLEYDTETRELTVLMENLRFPNGIQLLPDEESVLVAETTMARIRRVHVAGLNKGGMDTFIDNLPGFPDNIRPSSSGGYWVAMSAVRPNPGFSMLDFLSQRPWIKKFIFKCLGPRAERRD
ncbi:hypothetical protein PFLUV_G00218880 [Perca fluviatilis]|uniref:Adipocyte plasma membrane-associated protein n=1 Tax=Perca fluviatilis TaxID=8168 RepID=A0A6A5E970_PERFL|nr:hypothetical protein PFLUV_G00218880 [Perca fluviatilis]